MQGGLELAFILEDGSPLDPKAIQLHARRFGLRLSPRPHEDGVVCFDMETAVVMVAQMHAPHPDALGMPRGPFTPTEDVLRAHRSHIVLTAMGLGGPINTRDATMLRLATAVALSTNGIAAMLGHGVTFHRVEVLQHLLENAEPSEAPVELCVDLTAAPEAGDRMSFLTHGLNRYGREEFFITAPIDGHGAADFALMLARWMVLDPDKTLPTGDTVGRDQDEKVEIKRAPHPFREGEQVIRLDLSE